jgi:hypothetical protein
MQTASRLVTQFPVWSISHSRSCVLRQEEKRMAKEIAARSAALQVSTCFSRSLAAEQELMLRNSIHERHQFYPIAARCAIHFANLCLVPISLRYSFRGISRR